MTQEEEKLHFDTFGFVVREGMYGAAEMARFSAWFDGFARYHDPFEGERQFVQPGLQLHLGLCEQYLDAAPYQSWTRWPSTGNQITSTTPESTTATT